MRAFASAIRASRCASVSFVHGARLLFEPTTWTAEKTTRDCSQSWFSG
jgi:hypothetical protein